MQKKCLTIHQNTGNCLWNLLFSCCMCSPEVKWRLWLQNVFVFFSWLWFIHLYISLSASELHTWLITVDWQTALSVISGGCCGLTRVSKLKRISYQKHFRRLSVCCWAATGGRSVSSSGDSVSDPQSIGRQHSLPLIRLSIIPASSPLRPFIPSALCSRLSGRQQQRSSSRHSMGAWRPLEADPSTSSPPPPPPPPPAAVGHIMNISPGLTPLKICILIGPKCRSSALSSFPDFFPPLSSLTDTVHTLDIFS